MASFFNGGFLSLAFLLQILLCWPKVDSEPLVPAVYVFGDSTIDSGNNNQIMTLIKANFPPYGKDFPGGIATGRFTNGKLVTDMLSSFVGLPDELPANLDPQFTGQKLLTGASFGSAGAGIDNSTSVPPGTITLAKQFENFKSYRTKLTDMIGEQNGSKILTEALFAISMGTNDFSENYYSNAMTRAEYNIEQFQNLLLQELQSFIQNIYKEGATKFLVIGVPPFGCLPSQITMHNLINGTCINEYNEVATSYNKKLSSLIQMMKPSLRGLQIACIDIYDKLFDIIVNPSKYGFVEARKGCCGTGLVESGGPLWVVPLGRRDSRSASKSGANNNIPAPNSTHQTLETKFKRQGLNVVDLVVLSSGHTIGLSRCTSFKQRLYNFTGNGTADPTLDQGYLKQLRTLCPQTGTDDNQTTPLDPVSPTKFDTNYFKNLEVGKGLLITDEILYSTNGSQTAALVKFYAKHSQAFFQQFAKSMLKMSSITPLIQPQGEIRKNCRKMN